MLPTMFFLVVLTGAGGVAIKENALSQTECLTLRKHILRQYKEERPLIHPPVVMCVPKDEK